MRKIGCLFLLCAIIILLANSCSIPAKKPEQGIWYCEELKISIDFSLANTNNICAKLYNDDGTYDTMGCHFDYGRGIYFFQMLDGNEVDYLNGSFKWKEREEKFIVTSNSDDCIYIFVKKGDDFLSYRNTIH